MDNSRGFVTIATGHDRYYLLARNLLHSYKLCTKNPCSFAIIADRENEYTREFDKVILISDPHFSYMDKLKLFRELPFNETIFIDADSLAYGDLNIWWDIFSKSGDFSLFGYAWRDLNSGRGWFVPEGMQEYTNQITFIPDFNGGVYYMRNTEICRKVFEIATYAALNYDRYQFQGFSAPADEPVLALGMAVCGCEPVNLPELVFAPRRNKIEADISIPRAIFHKNSKTSYSVRLIHWSNYRTRQSLYRFEANKLEHIYNNQSDTKNMRYTILYRWKLLYFLFHVYDLSSFAFRLIGKIKRLLKK